MAGFLKNIVTQTLGISPVIQPVTRPFINYNVGPGLFYEVHSLENVTEANNNQQVRQQENSTHKEVSAEGVKKPSLPDDTALQPVTPKHQINEEHTDRIVIEKNSQLIQPTETEIKLKPGMNQQPFLATTPAPELENQEKTDYEISKEFLSLKTMEINSEQISSPHIDSSQMEVPLTQQNLFHLRSPEKKKNDNRSGVGLNVFSAQIPDQRSRAHFSNNTVHVNIGRIELKAVQSALQPPKIKIMAKKKTPLLSLEDYLKQRI